MKVQRLINLSVQNHSAWQVRPIVGLAAHVAIGATGQLFEFRKKGESAVYPFVFLGFGLGAGPQLGAGAANFPTPHEFIWQTTKVIGNSFYEAGRQLMGSEPKQVEPPKYAESMASFNDIEVSSDFSALDLDRAMGRFTSASASLAMGYSVSYITAFKLNRIFFESQSTAGEGAFGKGVVGGTTGLSLGANTNAGIWLRYSG